MRPLNTTRTETWKKFRLWAGFEPTTSAMPMQCSPILGDPGAVSGDGEKSKTGEKKFGRRKVKNAKKSPWGQCFNRPVPNGQASSGFWLVPENLCIFLPNHRAARLGAISRLLTRQLQCRPVARHVYSRRKVPITAQILGEIVRHIR